jgi:hypothetical protein
MKVKLLIILSFILISVTFSRSNIQDGTTPDYYLNQGKEIKSFYTSQGVEGQIKRSLIDLNNLKYITVTYQHYGNSCDEFRCQGLGYSTEVFQSVNSFPKFLVKNNYFNFTFESKKYQFSNAARKKYSSKYFNTAYLVNFIYKFEKFKKFFFEAPKKSQK